MFIVYVEYYGRILKVFVTPRGLREHMKSRIRGEKGTSEVMVILNDDVRLEGKD